MGSRPRSAFAGRLLAVVLALAAHPARAESGPRLFASGAAGIVLGGDQLDWLAYDGIIGRVGAAVGYALEPGLFVLELTGAAAVFGSSGRDGSLFDAGGGVRLDVPVPLGRARWNPWAHVDLGITGGKYRPAVDLGMALLFDLSASWALGPVGQYGRVIQPDGDRYSTDANYFTGGIGVAWRPEPARKPAQPAPRRLIVTHHERTRETEPPPTVAPSPEVLLLVEKAAGSLASEVDMIPPILFEFDSVTMIPCGEAALYYARDAVQAATGPVVLEGHADGVGEEDYNVDLAQRRAEYVRDWLVRHGVARERLRVEVYGEAKRLADETDDSRRQINRRVIIRLEQTP